MLRRLYIYVLRLHPPAFRGRFGNEMLSIFDDSTESASGFRLLLDCFVSLLRQWTLRPDFRFEHPSLSQSPGGDGVPTFSTLDSFHPTTAALIHGLLLSSALFTLTCFAIKYSWIHVLHVRIPEVQFGPSQPEVTNFEGGLGKPPRAAGTQAPIPTKTVANTGGSQTASASRRLQTAQADGSQFDRKLQTASEQEPAGAVPRIVKEQQGLELTERHRIIQAAARNIEESYFDPQVGRKTADALLAHEKNGDYNRVDDDDAFADLVTRQMQETSRDPHLNMEFSKTPLPIPHAPTAQEVIRYQQTMAQLNCTFEKVRILPQNIGYLKLNSFPDISICESAARSAMSSLNQADAIIFDLRDNGGGEPAMVALIAAYLFDHPEYWYNPREGTTVKSWTRSPVAQSQLADKPVYVLTSSRTYSGAEQFSYNLKMLKRATIVGETTGGAAHAGVWHRIDDHFGMGIPEVKAINPFADTDWAETGVEPDVKVKPEDALQTAEKLAGNRLRRK